MIGGLRALRRPLAAHAPVVGLVLEAVPEAVEARAREAADASAVHADLVGAVFAIKAMAGEARAAAVNVRFAFVGIF